jgi:hypothetical protein
MKLIYFFTNKKRWALRAELEREVRKEVKRQIQDELRYYRSDIVPTNLDLETKDFGINVNVALLVVNQARKKFRECWHIDDALDIILNAFTGISTIVALDLLLGKIAATVDLANNKIVLVSIEDHPEFKLSDSMRKELDDNKVVSLKSFIRYLKLQR